MADVSSDIKDWSVTASSNLPADATTVGAGLADNLQQIQATTRAAFAHKGSDIASATTTDIGAVTGAYHDITGTTTITGFGTVSAGVRKVLQFDGVLTLTYNATSLILPGNANITTAAGDQLEAMSLGSGNWVVLWYTDDSTVPQLLDEDDMASDSAVSVASQQSIKAYINTTGPWFPSVGGTATYTTQQGRYIKIGKLVWVQGDININNLGSGSANTISGLPFQAFQSSSPLSITIASGLAISVVSIVALTGGGTSNITFSGRTAAATGTSNTMNVIASGTSISFAGCYESIS